MERKTVARVVADRLLLAGLAVLLAAPVILVFWMMNRAPDEIASRDDLAKVSDSETLLVTRNLDDDALEELPRFTELEELQLNLSDVTDAGMARVGERTTLKRLWLNCQQVTDEGLAKLADLQALEVFMIVGMPRVTHEGFAVLRNMRNLKRLAIVRCPAVGDGLSEHLAGLPLEEVDLEQSIQIADSTAKVLATLKTLRDVNLNFCAGVSDDGVVALSNLPQIEKLRMHDLPTMTDRSLEALANAKTLKLIELPIHNDNLSEAAIERLREALPECEVVNDKIVD
jgi:hypothetical protein